MWDDVYVYVYCTSKSRLGRVTNVLVVWIKVHQLRICAARGKWRYIRWIYP